MAQRTWMIWAMGTALWAAPPIGSQEQTPPNAGPSDSLLHFSGVWEKVERAHPLALVNSAEQAIADGEIKQADQLPLPSLHAETEDFLGTDPFVGADAAATTVTLGFAWEPFGQRAARRRVAEAKKNTTSAEAEFRRMQGWCETLRRMDKAYGSGLRVEIFHQRFRLADSLVGALEERRKVGAVSSVAVTQARLAAASAKNEWLNQIHSEQSLRADLAALWGQDALDQNLRLANPWIEVQRSFSDGSNGLSETSTPKNYTASVFRKWKEAEKRPRFTASRKISHNVETAIAVQLDC